MTTEPATNPTKQTSMPSLKRRPPYFLLAVLLLTSGGWLAAFLFDFPAIENVAIAIFVGLNFVCLPFWLDRLTNWPALVRWSPIFVAILAGIAFFALIEIRGVDGNLVPTEFGWRFGAPDADYQLASVENEQLALSSEEFTINPEEDFYQFLGPNRRGEMDAISLDPNWEETPPKPIWKQPIGAGWSAFVIADGYAFTQEQRGEKEAVTCYKADTGELVWSHAEEIRYDSVVAGDGPRATPTLYQDHILAIGSTGVFVCLDAKSGELQWKHDFTEEYGAENPQWGYSASPLGYKNTAIAVAGGDDGKSIIAYDLESGEEVWGTGGESASYSSPTLVNLLDTEQLIVLTESHCYSLNPEDGSHYWDFDWKGSNAGSCTVSQPVAVDHEHVLLSKGYGIGAELIKISQDEEGDWSAESVWKNRNLKTKFTNVVQQGDYVYGLDEGIFSCVEWKTGRKMWKKGRFGHGQILRVGDWILILSEQGELVLVSVNPDKFEQVATFPALEGKTWNNLALEGVMLYVRNFQEAACYELPTK
ncbi:Alcohol dehydrogenase [Planctomycetales bacterium 10988]|nr:Alcohol dehydrogenase [Planctomycetales bacterium 10988]